MPGFKKLPNAKPIVNITIDEELLERIEDYHFNHRIPNRSQAFASLIVEGFERLREQERLIEYEYVSFEVAMLALKNGKKIKRKNDDAWYTDLSMLEFPFIKFVKEFVDCNEWAIKD